MVEQALSVLVILFACAIFIPVSRRALRHALSPLREYFVEPLLLTYAVFVIFTRWQIVYNSIDHTGRVFPDLSRLLPVFWKDATMSPQPYVFFALVFSLWVLLRFLSKREDRHVSETREATLLAGIRESSAQTNQRLDRLISLMEKHVLGDGSGSEKGGKSGDPA